MVPRSPAERVLLIEVADDAARGRIRPEAVAAEQLGGEVAGLQGGHAAPAHPAEELAHQAVTDPLAPVPPGHHELLQVGARGPEPAVIDAADDALLLVDGEEELVLRAERRADVRVLAELEEPGDL